VRPSSAGPQNRGDRRLAKRRLLLVAGVYSATERSGHSTSIFNTSAVTLPTLSTGEKRNAIRIERDIERAVLRVQYGGIDVGRRAIAA
jgi:phosphatidylserine decarboxylase